MKGIVVLVLLSIICCAYCADPAIGVCRSVLIVDHYVVAGLPSLTAAQIQTKYTNYWADVNAFYQNKFNVQMPLAYIYVESTGSFSSTTDAGTLLNDFNNAVTNRQFGASMPTDACEYHLVTGRRPPGTGGLAWVGTTCFGLNRGLSVDGSGSEGAELVIRRMIHEIGHNFNGNHPDYYTGANPSYSCSTNDDMEPLRILRESLEEPLPAAIPEAESLQARSTAAVAYTYLNSNAFISECATNAIKRSVSAATCLWTNNPTSPYITWYNDINYGGSTFKVEAHRGTGSSVCYNLVTFSRRASSFQFVGAASISVYTFDDCRGTATSFTGASTTWVGTTLNDQIVSFRFL